MRKVIAKIPKPGQYVIIIIIFVAAVFGVIELFHFYHKYSSKRNARELVELKLKGEVEILQKNITSIEQIPKDMAYVLEFSSPKKEEMYILLNSVLTNANEVFGMSIAFEPNLYNKDTTYYAPYLYKKDGKIVSVDAADTTYHYFSQDWYLLPKSLNKPVWIEPYFDEGSTGGNVVLTTYSFPFYSFDGEKETLRGIIAIDVSLEWLSKTVSSIVLINGSYSILVSENGTILSSPNPQWPYNESLFSLADEHHRPILREIGRNLQRGKSGYANIGKFDSKRDLWAYYMPIPENNWGVLILVPE